MVSATHVTLFQSSSTVNTSDHEELLDIADQCQEPGTADRPTFAAILQDLEQLLDSYSGYVLHETTSSQFPLSLKIPSGYDYLQLDERVAVHPTPPTIRENDSDTRGKRAALHPSEPKIRATCYFVAVIVGCQRPRYGDYIDLTCPVADAKRMAEIFELHGYNHIELLHDDKAGSNDQPTKYNILVSINGHCSVGIDMVTSESD